MCHNILDNIRTLFEMLYLPVCIAPLQVKWLLTVGIVMNYNISKGCLAPQVGNDKDAETLNRLAYTKTVVKGFGLSELSLFICHV